MTGAVSGRRAAVIGATGFIGSHLAGCLVQNGAAVLAVARDTLLLPNLSEVANACRFVVADILDAASICAALREFKPDLVFHLAADVDAGESFAHMRSSLECNAIGTANVLEAASAAGAEVLVYADSCKVYGNGRVPYRAGQAESPICSYAVAKAAGWHLCRLVSAATGMAVCGLRSTFTYGPRQSGGLIRYVQDCARRNAPVLLQGGSQTRDPLYVGDAVRAFISAATEPSARGHAIPIGGGAEISVIEFCREILNVLGSGVEVIGEAQPPRPTEIWRSYCDNADSKTLLRWSPAVGLREGLTRMLLGTPPARDLSLAGAERLP